MKIFDVVATVMIFSGIVGVVTKDVKRRMLGIFLTVVGMLLLANVQGGAYGFFGGMLLLAFQLPTLLIFLTAFGSLCKKNHINEVSGFIGFRKSHPWILLLFLVMGAILIGIPGTGTFGAYMIEVNAILTTAGNAATTTTGVETVATSLNGFQVISLLGMLVGIILLGIQFFDIWIHMMLVAPVDNKVVNMSEVPDLNNLEENPTKEFQSINAILGLHKGVFVLNGIVLGLLVLLGVIQGPLMAVISILYNIVK
ncbi:MAG: proton-conducting transporter membrane subunit [Lachnospiraceae bacterium]